jgi:hypothetical protein
VMQLVIDAGRGAPALGLGLAAVRDFAAHLKGEGPASVLSERSAHNTAVIAFGVSQSGRFLRQFVYDGFNLSEQRQRVFDGLFVAVAGAGRGSFNHRYAMPGQAGNSVLSVLRPVDLFPFADGPQTDLDGRRSDGLLARARADGVVPKIVSLSTSSEYWARAASLLTVQAERGGGFSELPLDAAHRHYFIAGSTHAGVPLAAPPERSEPFRPLWPAFNLDHMRHAPALLVALHEWAAQGKEPPPSVYPRLGSTLVLPHQVSFPALPGILFPTAPPPLWQLDFGPQWETARVIGNEPPRLGRRYVLHVPQVDADGNELGGLRGPFAAVPMGTFTGWAYSNHNWRSFGYLSGIVGGFVPFACTKAEREAVGDPRPSLEERYVDDGDFAARVGMAIDRAIGERLLLSEERQAELARAQHARAQILQRHCPQPASPTAAPAR